MTKQPHPLRLSLLEKRRASFPQGRPHSEKESVVEAFSRLNVMSGHVMSCHVMSCNVIYIYIHICIYVITRTGSRGISDGLQAG